MFEPRKLNHQELSQAVKVSPSRVSKVVCCVLKKLFTFSTAFGMSTTLVFISPLVS